MQFSKVLRVRWRLLFEVFPRERGVIKKAVGLAKRLLKQFLIRAWLAVPSFKGLTYKPDANVFLFLPINGAGLGHLTRSLAVARRLQQQKPDAKIVFLTTSIGVALVHRAGFACHHVPPAALLNESPVAWNQLFFRNIDAVLALHRPGTLVFDGTAPLSWVAAHHAPLCQYSLCVDQTWLVQGRCRSTEAQGLYRAF
ncbi:UDP-N-acetylglucosamine--N-acetylmuramyl-(pentapeptide) pyrophosphoryl-undecaprenol N-acetylglucosamine transferase [Pseudomonas sp. MAFF212428]|uniref:UDP-N-acetylglucosamine--N-acetylmuramyl-(Pentapeptide) pyrophosphoryl-undecaprenol N-acetylglucosamine transferase n=1 Tax=Pseudomonas brassicae TaxID=2708063 RepID=A0A6M0CUU8_9PSED|nr:UDP-N-acetylglucosamine--N-acetylmuramyl-(pentapeptide) pyrophosphoryl-undecaprenol N-acetylglucosamine transferase [Pseudomonas brassicae]